MEYTALVVCYTALTAASLCQILALIKYWFNEAYRLKKPVGSNQYLSPFDAILFLMMVSTTTMSGVNTAGYIFLPSNVTALAVYSIIADFALVLGQHSYIAYNLYRGYPIILQVVPSVSKAVGYSVLIAPLLFYLYIVPDVATLLQAPWDWSSLQFYAASYMAFINLTFDFFIVSIYIVYLRRLKKIANLEDARMVIITKYGIGGCAFA
ncbi:hypothetical protein BC830DRAFT_143364, partial [Chytriomyces sp. MP71]